VFHFLKMDPNILQRYSKSGFGDVALYTFLRGYKRTTIDEANSKEPKASNITVWVNDLWGTRKNPDAALKMQNLGGLRALKRANVFGLNPRQRVSFMRSLNGQSTLSIDGIYKHKNKNKFAIVVHQPKDYSMHAAYGLGGALAGIGSAAGTFALTKFIDREYGDDKQRKQNLDILDWPVAELLEYDRLKLKDLEKSWDDFQKFKGEGKPPEHYPELRQQYNALFADEIKREMKQYEKWYPIALYLSELGV
jgi:hypothetical protein